MEPTADVTISLTADQALVLFDWMTREGGTERLPTTHRAEDVVLWAIEAQLEKCLVEPLQPDYLDKVAAARERLAAGLDE
jgi:hypothetical protein